MGNGGKWEGITGNSPSFLRLPLPLGEGRGEGLLMFVKLNCSDNIFTRAIFNRDQL
jgi:hypothetical protein